jgi:putative ABC transport system permease protein
MRFIDLLRLIMDNLGRRKGRVMLTAIGVVIGTASVILLISLAIGLQKSATSNLWGISDLRRIDVYPGYSEVPMGMAVSVDSKTGMPAGMQLLTPQTIEDIKALPGVEMVTPRQNLYGQAVLKAGRLENYAWFNGVDLDDIAVFEYPLQSGVTTLSRGQAIIGGWAAQQFYDPKQRPGQDPPVQPDVLDQTLRLVLTKWTNDGVMVNKTVNLKIVGVLSQAQGEQDGMIIVGLDDLTAWNEWFMGTRVNYNRDGYNQLIVRSIEPDQATEIADAINTMGYQASTSQDVVQGINSFFIVLQVVFGGIGAISLLVAAIGIANTMAMAILERTREIGLMKAVGATNKDVLSIFLGEAAGIGFIGGIGGVIIGWGGSFLLNMVASTFMPSNPYGGTQLATSTPIWLPAFALIFATLVGIISGLYPSLRAATLVPVNALKYE